MNHNPQPHRKNDVKPDISATFRTFQLGCSTSTQDAPGMLVNCGGHIVCSTAWNVVVVFNIVTPEPKDDAAMNQNRQSIPEMIKSATGQTGIES